MVERIEGLSMDTFKKAALVAILAILLRLVIVGLYRYIESPIWLVSTSGFFILPMLGLLVLLLAVVPSMTFWEKRDEITRIGMNMLPVVMINAFLRFVELVRMGETCEGPDSYKYEMLCEDVIAQTAFNIPIVLIGALVLFIWKHRE